MRTLALVLAVSVASAAYAQDGCKSVTSSSSSVPESAGCIPLTYTPAEGGPARSVWAPATFTGSQTAVPQIMKPKYQHFELGAYGSYVMPDYGHSVNTNVGVFAAYTMRYLGVEADATDTVVNRGGIHEDSLVIGPRFQFPIKFVTLYAKAQAGAGRFSGTPSQPINDKNVSFIEQYGGGIDIKAAKHLKVRLADYSYQVWPQFSPTNLTPYQLSSGLAMTF